jgi:hypothetical protein
VVLLLVLLRGAGDRWLPLLQLPAVRSDRRLL